ncbi:MAG: cache domain-containing protein, partial [Chloroflexota bacterium]
MDNLRRFFRFQYSLRVRLTVPFLLITVVVAGLGVYVITRLTSGSVQERLANQLVDSAQTASETIVDYERQTLATLRLMTNTSGVGEAVRNNDIEALNPLIQPIAINEELTRVIVFDAAGNNIYQFDATPTTTTINVAFLDVVAQVVSEVQDEQGDKFAAIVTHPEAPNTPYLYISAPILTPELVGGIMIGVPMPQYVQLVSSRAIVQVMYYDLRGNLLGTTFPGGEGLLLSEGETSALIAEAASTAPISQVTLDDNQYNVLYAPLQVRGTVVGLAIYGLRSDFIVDLVNNNRNTLTLVFTFLFLAVLAVGYLTSQSVLRPL